MAMLDVASRGTPRLVYSTAITAEFCRRSNLFSDIRTTVHDAESVGNDATVRLTLSDGTSFQDRDVLLYLAKFAVDLTKSPESVIEWITKSEAFSVPEFHQFRGVLEEIDAHLTLRSHLIGHHLSFEDLVVWAAISSNPVAASWVRKAKNNITRWYIYIEDTAPWAKETLGTVLKTVQQGKAASRAAASAAGASYDIDLPQVSGPIITRFPPEPSGYLHIGHAKAALLNEHFARLREGGRLICRFDDTNPTRESMEFQDSIMHDLKLMGIIPDQVTYSSDYFQDMYDCALRLIKDGKAFAEDAELGKGDEDRKNRLPSKRRNMSVEETLDRFEDMKSGSDEGRRWALRARIAYDSPNGTLRDPVIYRCNLAPHHRTGTTWKIYPTYDFCAPILDSIEGVTVALRTNEYRDRNAQYQWMQEALGLRTVPIWDFSRLNFVRTVLSKRKLTVIVDEGKVSGWDDPRMPTIRGLLRRGVAVAALREFILKQGPSRNVLNMEWSAFWAMNRKFVDPTAPRYTAIATSGVVPCSVQGAPESEFTLKPKHPKNPDLGDKTVVYAPTILLEQIDAETFEEGEEITLMNWGNGFVRRISRQEDGLITALDIDLHIEGDFKKTKKKVTWLAKFPSNLIPVDLVSFDYLITKDKLEKQDQLKDYLTPITEFCTEALADCNVAELVQGVIIQFERKGLYKLDVAYHGDGSRAIFFEIPSKG
ncbi:hypothetical protein S7711_03599 [Stachybotrys chartarum IBT 7711]|uniref:glutamate--tRNA ligase n=1 Tax=Stachybotrys chartarum (strain CBS 109288 / IBT 7711) TaxID=1280523 RepID=A0A084AGV3_STACB|nr:hypothetical protein S7711_03599 [Stachybotrys chartarum IBT 7711]